MSNVCSPLSPVSQYANSPLFKAWLASYTDRTKEVCEAYGTLELFFSIDSATGKWLDLLGIILGQPRDVIDASLVNFFAFDNTDPLTSGFGVGKFWNGKYAGALQNLLTYSEELNNSAWNQDTVDVFPDEAVAPDGSLTADKITALNSTHGINRQYDFDGTPNYCLSIHVKNIDATTIKLQVDSGYTLTVFDFASETFISGASNGVAEKLENGWWKLSLINTGAQTEVTRAVRYVIEDTKSVYMWGAQLNEGGIKPYLKTQSTPILSQENIVKVDDITYRKLIKARAFKNASGTTIEDIITAVLLLTGRSDCNVLDGGLGDSSTVTPALMTYALEFDAPIDDDDRTLILALDLLPRPAGVEITTVVP